MSKILINGMARRADRRLADPPVDSVIRTKDNHHDVGIINLSRRGLRFRSKNRYKAGDKLWFELRSSDANSELSLSIRGKIVNEYGGESDSLHEYGVRFFRLLYWYEMNCIHNYVYSYSE